MTYKQAMRECKRVGCANATGDALRAMYANLVTSLHGGAAEKYFAAIPGGTDTEITESSRELLRDRAKAWDALLR